MYQVSQSFQARNSHQDFSHATSANAGLLGRAADLFWSWRERHRSRAGLVGLPDAVLKDIGLSRGDAEQEWEKPFWRG